MPHRSILLCLLSLALSASEPARPIRILPMGDSITAGYTDSGFAVPFSFGYRAELYRLLGLAGYRVQFVGHSQQPWDGMAGPVTLPPGTFDLRICGQDFHDGYGGAASSAFSNPGQLAGAMRELEPDVILLMIGINDISGAGPRALSPLKANLDVMVDTITASRPEAHLIVAQITPLCGADKTLIDYNSFIKDELIPSWRAKGRTVSTVDQYRNFLTKDGAIDPGLYSNGINHPNATGYDRMARTWLEGIEAVIPIPHAEVPAAPSGLMAAAVSANRISLHWHDNAGDETIQEIKRAEDPGFTTGLRTLLAAADATAFVDGGLAPAKTYYYRICAHNAGGDSASSSTVEARTPISVNRARFLGLDAATSGSWRNVYGADGAQVFGDETRLPAYAKVTFLNGSAYQWPAADPDQRALQRMGDPSARIASCWNSVLARELVCDVCVEGVGRRIALYFLDWDRNGRSQRIMAIDPGTGDELAPSQTLGDLTNGAYLVYEVTGDVRFRIAATGPSNAVMSGIFFGPPVLP
jgi:lysophospholipase L1-like esterase